MRLPDRLTVLAAATMGALLAFVLVLAYVLFPARVDVRSDRWTVPPVELPTPTCGPAPTRHPTATAIATLAPTRAPTPTPTPTCLPAPTRTPASAATPTTTRTAP